MATITIIRWWNRIQKNKLKKEIERFTYIPKTSKKINIKPQKIWKISIDTDIHLPKIPRNIEKILNILYSQFINNDTNICRWSKWSRKRTWSKVIKIGRRKTKEDDKLKAIKNKSICATKQKKVQKNVKQTEDE